MSKMAIIIELKSVELSRPANLPQLKIVKYVHALTFHSFFPQHLAWKTLPSYIVSLVADICANIEAAYHQSNYGLLCFFPARIPSWLGTNHTVLKLFNPFKSIQ